MSGDQKELVSFLSDMYSVEQQAIAQLISAPALVGDRQFSDDLRRHYVETQQHLRLLRERLDAHDKPVSMIKTAIMKAGGKAFLFFALSQPETPGKLAAHSYSYEAMEWAGYEILQRLAKLADDPQTLAVAFVIRNQERAMMERLERDFDAVEATSHRDVYPEAMRIHLRSHLREAHALEVQSANLIKNARKIANDPFFAEVCSQNLQKAYEHARALEVRLSLLGAKPSKLEDSGLAFSAWNWNLLFKFHSDSSVKVAAFAYGHEHLKTAAYELLGRAAKRARDAETGEFCAQLVKEERAMADHIAGTFDSLVQTTLREIRS
jgi:ferritin-like metal-binding protein YciE